jgi:hypothetical protein
MTPNLGRALWFFLGAQTFLLASGFLMFAMIGDVNRAAANGKRISYLLGHFPKYVKVLREYRRLYPAGRLTLYFKLSLAIGLALLIGSAWQVGLLR